MIVKQALTTAAAICMICIAILLTQTVLGEFATATPANGQNGNSLKQRVLDLEEKQEGNEKEFFIIDTGLSDLDMRVLDLEKRAGARGSSINDLGKRLSSLRASNRSDHRLIFADLEKIKADIRGLKSGD
ncbi:MAG: hypothetical protein P8J27_14555 [Mariniblastus sp.]|nr:hypothetical protein [Mariniblastus sp.]